MARGCAPGRATYYSLLTTTTHYSLLPLLATTHHSLVTTHDSRLTSRPGLEVDEYVHWTFPEDDPAQAEPSYMMARRLRPRSERAAAGEGKNESAGSVAGAGAGTSKAAGATAAASQQLMRDARPEVVASGKRAAFIRVIEEAKEAQAAKEKVHLLTTP